MDKIKDNRDFKGVWIPKEIYLEKSLSWTEKILLVEIDSLDNDIEKGCFASNEYLAQFLNKSEKTIKNILSELQKKKYLKQIFFDGRKRGLRVCFDCFKYNDSENLDLKNKEELYRKKYGRGTEKSTAEVPKTGRQQSRKRDISSPENGTYNNTYNNTDNNTEREREKKSIDNLPQVHDVEFMQLFELLINSENWHSKNTQQIEFELKELNWFDDKEFAKRLVKQALKLGYKTCTFPETKTNYINWKKKIEKNEIEEKKSFFTPKYN